MRKFLRLVFILLLGGGAYLSIAVESNFLEVQKKYERVRGAIAEKDEHIRKMIKDHQISIESLNLLIVAYKDEGILEVFAKNKNSKNYKKINSYPICAKSGELGPKRRMGDMQVPEGFYYIDRFNAASSYYLSLGLNYPNKSDKIKGDKSNLGGDIFIHGSCVTIGCLPMTNDYIKEIYLLAVYAKNKGQKNIPVYIFPFKMADENMHNFKEKYKENKALLRFWDNLKIGYLKFRMDARELQIDVKENGDYTFK